MTFPWKISLLASVTYTNYQPKYMQSSVHENVTRTTVWNCMWGQRQAPPIRGPTLFPATCLVSPDLSSEVRSCLVPALCTWGRARVPVCFEQSWPQMQTETLTAFYSIRQLVISLSHGRCLTVCPTSPVLTILLPGVKCNARVIYEEGI